MDLWAEAAPCLKDVLFLPGCTRALLLLLSRSSQSILTSSFCRVWRRWYAPCAGSLIFSPPCASSAIPCSRSWLTSRVIGTSPALASRYKRGMRSSAYLGRIHAPPLLHRCDDQRRTPSCSKVLPCSGPGEVQRRTKGTRTRWRRKGSWLEGYNL